MTTGPADSRTAVTQPAPGEPWTVLQLVRWSAGWLEGKGVERPRLDVELLLADALGMDRLHLYLGFDRPLVEEELAVFRSRLRRRAAREPLQYILGRTHFRELQLRTDRRALIPRPETEELVGAVLKWMAEQPEGGDSAAVLEVGTGSGAIALSLAVEGSFGRIVASDLSSDALALARDNLDAHLPLPGPGVELRQGSLFDVVVPGERFRVIVSNPPYVAEGEWEGLEPEIREWEPRSALTSGGDGLEVMAALVAQAPDHLEPGGLLALEIGAGQGVGVLERVQADGRYRSPSVVKDLSGRDRMVLAVTAGAG